MRRPASFVLLFLACAGLLAGPTGPAAAQEEASVAVVKVDGSIDRTVAGYLRDALADAERTGSTVILQLDSAGTLDQDAIEIARWVHEAAVPVIAWVGPAPAKVQGAALLLMYAASDAAVAPGAGVGPLEPLDLAGAPQPSPSAVRELASEWMQERDRPISGAFPPEPVPAQEALDEGIAAIPAASLPDLLD